MINRSDHISESFDREMPLSGYIPYACFIDDETIETKSGHLLQFIKLDGLYSTTLDDAIIDREKNRRHAMWFSLADPSTLFYLHTIRRKTTAQLNGSYSQFFAAELHQKYQKTIDEKSFYINEHYVTVVKKSPTNHSNKLIDIFKSLSGKSDRLVRRQYREITLNDLNKITRDITTQLARYGARKLVNERSSLGMQSEALSFLFYLVNLETRNLLATQHDLSNILSHKRLFIEMTSGTLAFRNNQLKTKYAAILAVKNYPDITHAQMLDPLLLVKTEFIMSQSFHGIEKSTLRNKIKEERRHHAQSDDGESSVSHEMAVTLDDLANGKTVSGMSHFSILCHGESRAELENNLATIEAALNQSNLHAVREDVGVKPAYFGMLPANQHYLARKAILTTKNIASLASFHSTYGGKAQGNHWGDAVTVLETASGAPYYFNFHHGDVGNTFMIGPMGSGKTLLQSFLLSGSMKLGGKLIAFDKDRGSEIFIRLMRGEYYCLTPSTGTGFAPFQLPDNPDNRHFLCQLLQHIAVKGGIVLNASIEKSIQSTVDGAYHLPQHKRLLRHVVEFLGMNKPGSLRSTFDAWIYNGEFAWVFDNEKDTLSLNYPIVGYDLTSILENPSLASIVYFYLFNRMQTILDGTRVRILAAECWRILQDPILKEFIREWSSTLRKRNAFLILDTQSPSDIALSDIGCKLIQETATQIYFANPKANESDYMGRFKLSYKEFYQVKTLEKGSRWFLLKQGHHSVVARCHLPVSFANEIDVLSGRTENLILFDKIRKQTQNRDVWQELFYQQLNEARVV